MYLIDMFVDSTSDMEKYDKPAAYVVGYSCLCYKQE